MRLPSVNSVADSPIRFHAEMETRMIPDKTKELIEQIKKD
jgi:hypothetical protein